MKLWPALALATVVFYFTPLFDSQKSIQWDAVDVHYSAQKYFADSLREGHLPQWTPFVFSGFPFLADPQTAAWYPLHWPFFLIGITPKAIEWELALHAFLALCGTYLLAKRLALNHRAALVAAVFYAGGGFFAGHSSHVGMFETAALLPWLLWAALRALEIWDAPSILLASGIGGLIALIGHFQTALYSFFALALLVIARRSSGKRAVSLLAFVTVATVLLSAIQTLPGLELTAQTDRATANYQGVTNAVLTPGSLATLILPNFYGAVSGVYSGPPDITQFYFYAGILLIPLAIIGIWKQRFWVPLALIVPALWYAFGPKTGLYSALTLLPGFKNVRAPVHIWFVVALGLSLAAASGAAWLTQRTGKTWITMAVLIFSVADVWYWNMADNPLAYANTTFAERYGDPFTNFQQHLAQIKQMPFYRIWAPYDTNSFGPLNSSLEGHTEVTYGYNPLELTRYREFLEAADKNPKLLNSLAVTHGIDLQRGQIVENRDVLPRISAPPQVQFVASHAAAQSLLASLDPAQLAIVETPLRPLAPTAVRISITGYAGDSYTARYSAASECLLRIAVPYFPGWRAAVDGKALPVYAVDDALSGVFVPAGNHELTFVYRSSWFAFGAILSLVTGLGLIAGLVILRKGSKEPPVGR
jgi:hypothetical protein